MLLVEIFDKKKKIIFNALRGEADTKRLWNFADF